MANNSLFINIAVLLWAARIEHEKDASGQLLPLDVDGFRGTVLSCSVSRLVTSFSAGANSCVLTGGQARSSARSLHASQKLQPCLHRDVSCGVCEGEATVGDEKKLKVIVLLTSRSTWYDWDLYYGSMQGQATRTSLIVVREVDHTTATPGFSHISWRVGEHLSPCRTPLIHSCRHLVSRRSPPGLVVEISCKWRSVLFAGVKSSPVHP
jgi:hypothetical protein